MSHPWYTVDNIQEIDSPALLIYKEKVEQNIARAIGMAGNASRLRPHVKTHKIPEVCRLMMNAGITKFKCATIAEAEMLGMVEAKDVLIAYALVGPKADRFIRLMEKYPATVFSSLVDHPDAARHLSDKAVENGKVAHVFIDLNTGMNRSGVALNRADDLLEKIKELEGIDIIGIHAYDGHIRDADPDIRQKRCDEEFDRIQSTTELFRRLLHKTPVIVIGGSPTFSAHSKRHGVECSPGTFVFWDRGYRMQVPELHFDYAAVLITRVISFIDDRLICTDLGYKSVASENPLPRIHFLHDENLQQVSQSEEHLVLKVPDSSAYAPGDVLYAVPMHICPSVALFEKVYVVEKNRVVDEWKVVARDRHITV